MHVDRHKNIVTNTWRYANQLDSVFTKKILNLIGAYFVTKKQPLEINLFLQNFI